MCRLLAVKGKRNFSMQNHLTQFALIAKNSKEFQGHGWGCSWIENGHWKHYKNIKPIWEDDLSRFSKTKLLLAHARSAFMDKGIKIENNMPFYDDKKVFIFNGELRGVKIKEKGRIGAEKIFNLIKRLGGDINGIIKAVDLIKRQSFFIRAINFIIADKNKIFIHSFFNEDTEYYTLRIKRGNERVICSSVYPDERGWETIVNDSLLVM